MSIAMFQLDRTRKIVAFFGEIPIQARETFEARGYLCEKITCSTGLENRLFLNVDSVIVIQDPLQPFKATHFLAQYAPLLLAADCRIYFRCSTKEEALNRLQMRGMVINAVSANQFPTIGLPITDREGMGNLGMGANRPALTPYIDIQEDKEDWVTLANRISANPAGYPPCGELVTHALNVKKEVVDLGVETDLLLRRAFRDCLGLRLEEIGHGKSAAKAYKAYAQRDQSYAGSDWPYQYFVKIGKREIIAKEYLNYRNTVLDHIPFHLGPRLREDRCVLGCELGIMVSDYVSNAEALSERARSGQAGAVLSNLLMHTVGSWRSGDKEENVDLKIYLLELFPKAIPDHRKNRIEALGYLPEHDVLRAIVQRYSSFPTLVGVIHGDMHAKNILVRGADAILIDFEKLNERSAVLCDLAAIEAGLLDECFFNDFRNAAELLRFLSPLYCAEAFSRCDQKHPPTTPGHWYFHDVRFIRTQAKSYERQPLQYAWTLAIVMLKKACNQANLNQLHAEQGKQVVGLPAEDVRAVMYILAAELINSLA